MRSKAGIYYLPHSQIAIRVSIAVLDAFFAILPRRLNRHKH
ncbi:hypothetical protein [Campylobacter concisus]|nr:hypothetical protein [Campylobacter concisus]